MGTLRIYFTADDIARTSLASGVDPLWEVLLSTFRLQDGTSPLPYRSWTRRMRRNPLLVEQIGPGMRMFAALAPRGPYFPDFLTPPEGLDGLETGLDAVMRTSRRRLRHEVSLLARHTRLPGWVHPVADADPASLGQLCAAIRSYQQAAIAPYWSHIQETVDADRARRIRGFQAGGIEGMLSTHDPVLRWRPPILEASYPMDQELHLHGRGIRLVPSYFCHGNPVTLVDPDLPPVLVYPVDQELRRVTPANKDLEALLGTTRATVLHAVETGATTTQLARRLNTSLASISRHTAVLRRAGLITSHRDGTAVLHTRTPLGTTLLHHVRPVPSPTTGRSARRGSQGRAR